MSLSRSNASYEHCTKLCPNCPESVNVLSQQALLVRWMTMMMQLWHAGFAPAWDGASIQAALGGLWAPWVAYLGGFGMHQPWHKAGSGDGHWPLGQLFPLRGSSPCSCPGLMLEVGSEEEKQPSSKGFRERKKHIKGRRLTAKPLPHNFLRDIRIWLRAY